MFNQDYWPTPPDVGARAIDTLGDIKGKKILEPQAGMGNLVIQLKNAGAEVIACEKEERLALVLEHLCPVIARDFFTVTPDMVSHIDMIVMNPPFISAARHIQHAWDIAPEGCTILSLCNYATVENAYTRGRETLKVLVQDYGYFENWGECFSTAERKTDVQVAMVYLRKPASNYDAEFEGFFMSEDPEEAQEEGMMQYDVIRDIVNRYVAAVKLYDKQLELGVQMNSLISSLPAYHNEDKEDMNYMTVRQADMEKARSRFKKGLQKRAWSSLFQKMDMNKYSTRGLRDDINKFVENQVNVPFTMRNVYKMFEIVIGTRGSRMDKALLEVFDKLTRHYDENRYGVEGWKTNSDYLVNQKFILNRMCYQDQRWNSGPKIETDYRSMESMDDVVKALCYLTGDNYDDFPTLIDACRERIVVSIDGKEYKRCREMWEVQAILKEYEHTGKTVSYYTYCPKYGEWFDWAYFEVKAFKKGTMHFKFKDVKLWELFNENIARIKGYVLPEAHKTRKGYQGDFFKDKQDAA